MSEIFNYKNQKIIRQKLRNNLTKSEVVLWKYLKSSQLGGWKFRRQQGIGKYVVDFYCPQLKLIVEVDGLTHYEESVFAKDEIREKYFKGLGLKVVRYSSQDVFLKIKNILEDLYNICLGLSKCSTTP